MNDNALTRPIVDVQHYVDRQPMPTHAIADNGVRVGISTDPRLPGLWREFMEDACTHSHNAVVERLNRAGHKFYTRYCSHCGVQIASMIAHQVAQSEGIAVDLTAAEMERRAAIYISQREAGLDVALSGAAYRAAYEVEKAQQEYSEKYQDYLRSPKWKRKVAVIMQRANSTCEGCLSRPAEEVHHTTYNHVFDEFAFELLALCAPCHRRYHNKAVA